MWHPLWGAVVWSRAEGSSEPTLCPERAGERVCGWEDRAQNRICLEGQAGPAGRAAAEEARLPVTPARQEPSFGGKIAPMQFHSVVELVKREEEHENVSPLDTRMWKVSGKEATPISFESRDCLVWRPREVLLLAKESHERKGQAGNLRQALPKSVSSGAGCHGDRAWACPCGDRPRGRRGVDARGSAGTEAEPGQWCGLCLPTVARMVPIHSPAQDLHSPRPCLASKERDTGHCPLPLTARGGGPCTCNFQVRRPRSGERQSMHPRGCSWAHAGVDGRQGVKMIHDCSCFTAMGDWASGSTRPRVLLT